MAFDSMSFCKAVNKDGRAYRYQAMELIRICRLFSLASQSPDQVVKLQRVLEACDKALCSAANSHKKTRGYIDHEIEDAIKKLHVYERDFHTRQTVETRMEAARNDDAKKIRKDIISASDRTLRVVSFHIMRSLPDNNPIIVEQAHISALGLPYILWNFIRYKGEKRLTLAQNPQFYEGPPAFPITYGPGSEIRPAEDYHGTIYVLTNNERRVFLEFGQKWRTFDNVWSMNDTLIFKDVIGNVEGEAIVGQSIPSPPFFWSRMEPPEFQPEAVGHINDWRAPIFDLWNSPHTGIHIRTDGHQAVPGVFIPAPPNLTTTGNMNSLRAPVGNIRDPPHTSMHIRTNGHQAIIEESTSTPPLLTTEPPGNRFEAVRNTNNRSKNRRAPIRDIWNFLLTRIHIRSHRRRG